MGHPAKRSLNLAGNEIETNAAYLIVHDLECKSVSSESVWVCRSKRNLCRRETILVITTVAKGQASHNEVIGFVVSWQTLIRKIHIFFCSTDPSWCSSDLHIVRITLATLLVCLLVEDTLICSMLTATKPSRQLESHRALGYRVILSWSFMKISHWLSNLISLPRCIHRNGTEVLTILPTKV